MEIAVTRRSRLVPLAALGIAAALALTFARPAGSAIPATAAVGKVTYADLSGTTDITMTIRSFEMDFSFAPDASRATFGAPVVVHDVVTRSPLIMGSLAVAKSLPTITVVLYRPSTTTRYEQWTFTDAWFTQDRYSHKGPASATPWETVSWGYGTVRQTTYQSDGVTVGTDVCFDLGEAYKFCPGTDFP